MGLPFCSFGYGGRRPALLSLTKVYPLALLTIGKRGAILKEKMGGMATEKTGQKMIRREDMDGDKKVLVYSTPT